MQLATCLEAVWVSSELADDNSTVFPCVGVDRWNVHQILNMTTKNLASRHAPHNSSRGIVNLLIGATLIFEVTRVAWILPVVSITRK